MTVQECQKEDFWRRRRNRSSSIRKLYQSLKEIKTTPLQSRKEAMMCLIAGVECRGTEVQRYRGSQSTEGGGCTRSLAQFRGSRSVPFVERYLKVRPTGTASAVGECSMPGHEVESCTPVARTSLTPPFSLFPSLHVPVMGLPGASWARLMRGWEEWHGPTPRRLPSSATPAASGRQPMPYGTPSISQLPTQPILFVLHATVLPHCMLPTCVHAQLPNSIFLYQGPQSCTTSSGSAFALHSHPLLSPVSQVEGTMMPHMHLLRDPTIPGF